MFGKDRNLDGEENCSDLKCWTPLVLEDVQADPTQLVNVRVVDPGDEPHLCRYKTKIIYCCNDTMTLLPMNTEMLRTPRSSLLPWVQTWDSPQGERVPI